VTGPGGGFEVAAERYDAFMGRWSRQLSPQLADLAGVDGPARVLDVGCGTGMLTAELVRRVGAAGVAAVDPSGAFVGAMRERFPGVDVRQAGAEALPWPDATFDAALAQLVVHFMTDPVGGLAEMRRVTRPGGVVAACVWDFGGGRWPLRTFWETARELDATVDDESERPGTNRAHLVELFAAAGLEDITTADHVVRLDLPGFDAWWQPFTLGVGPAGQYLASLDEAGQARMREGCRARLPDGPFTAAGAAWAARGTA
jgi:SAM-dependent methyltransferase